MLFMDVLHSDDGHSNGVNVPDLPETRPLSTHQASGQLDNGVWAVVDVPVEKLLGPVEKINITVPTLVPGTDENRCVRQEPRHDAQRLSC